MVLQTVETAIDVKGLIGKFTYTPYPLKVVVKEIEIQQTYGGIVVPESARESEMKTNEGYVIKVGDGVDFCQAGDRILYGRYSGAWFEVGGEKYRIMNEKDIILNKGGLDVSLG